MRWLAALVVAGSAWAQLGHEPLMPDPERLMVGIGRGAALALPGSLRLTGGYASGVEVSSEDPAVGAETPEELFGEARLRLRPAFVMPSTGFWSLARLALDAELTAPLFGGDAVTGLEYDPRQQRRDDGVTARVNQFYGLLAGQYLALKTGYFRTHFGLGVLSNDGTDPQLVDGRWSVEESPFGFAHDADTSARVQVAVFPLPSFVAGDGTSARPLTLLLAGGAVTADDTVDDPGDAAWEALGGVLFRTADLQIGAGTQYRNQTYAEGGETEVWVPVLYARYDVLYRPATLWVAAEGAGLVGETTLVQSVLRESPFEVRAMGGVARVGALWEALEGVLEVGYASGDDNPFDDQVRQFSFDREYRVGLLMFDEALRQTTAVTAYNAADETYRGEPSRGFDSLASDGAVRGAVYLNPRVGYSIAGASLVVGYVYGRSEEPYADAFRTGLAGGVPTGHRGAKQPQELGHEVDVGLSYGGRVGPLALQGRAQLAWFKPGDVFETATGDAASDMTGYWLYVEAGW